MSGLRINPILILSVAALIAVAIAATAMLWQGRDGQMRDSEADFLAKVRAGEVTERSSSAFFADSKPSAPDAAPEAEAPQQADAEADLAAWYAEAGDADRQPVKDAPVKAAETASPARP